MLLGFLSPEGIFFPCACFGHFALARDILENEYKINESYDPVDKLCDLGWCVIQGGFIGFSGYYTHILTKKQEEWLDAHFNELDRYQHAAYKNIKELNELLKEKEV